MDASARMHILTFPYETLERVTGGHAQLRVAARLPGSALVWEVGAPPARETVRLIEARPGGLPLIAALPDTDLLQESPRILAQIQRCRPHGLLPGCDDLHPGDVAAVLRRPPLDLPADVTDYLRWRGVVTDMDTTRLLRRVIELSQEAHSITALSKHLYMSRRALGRRFLSRGLPVPSHWLQLSRILRLSSRLQNTDASIFSLAYEAGYPDGFSVSNQMQRLIGYRPSQVRDFLGWEWIVEAWLRREAESGGLTPTPPTAPGARLAPSTRREPAQQTPIRARRHRRSVA